MKIDQCQIENFTVFEKLEFDFCPGVNVIVGANGTGKSHLLKILYAMTQWVSGAKADGVDREQDIRVVELLNGLFKPEGGEVGLLVRTRGSSAVADIRVRSGDKHQSVRIYSEARHPTYDPSIIAQAPEAKGVFIPPNEVLAIYPGFMASYEKRELAFDQTYYDLCRALSAAPLKRKRPILSRLRIGLEGLLHGVVVQRGNRFYVQDEKGEKSLEAHLLAEGHRKIAALVHLINNGSIDKGSILFWDEPEANLNPRLIGHIAVFLRELAKAGVQVFAATHDYLLTGELSLAAEYETQPQVPIRFLGLSRQGDESVTVQSGATLADLDDNPILDEFALHYRREQDAAIQHMNEGATE